MKFICTAIMINMASSANSRESSVSPTSADRYTPGYDEKSPLASQGSDFRFINNPPVALPFAFEYPHTSQAHTSALPIYQVIKSHHDRGTSDHPNDINQFGEEWLHSLIQHFLKSDVIIRTSTDLQRDEIAIGCEALTTKISDYYQLSFQFPLETLLWLRIICPSSDELLQQNRLSTDSQTVLNTMDAIKQRIDYKNLPYIDSPEFSEDKLNKLRAKWFRARQAFVKDFRNKSGIFQTSPTNPYRYKLDDHDHQSTVGSSPKTSNSDGAQTTPSDTNEAFIDSMLKSFSKAQLQSYELSKYDEDAEAAVGCDDVVQFLAESTSDIDPISKDLAMMMMIICPSYAEYVDTTFSFSAHELQEGYLNIMHVLYKYHGHIDVAKQQLLNQLAELATLSINWNVEMIGKLKKTRINCDSVRKSLADYHGYLLNETAVGLIIFCPGNGTQEEIIEIKQFATNKDALAQGTKMANKWTEELLAKASRNRHQIRPRPLLPQRNES